MNEAGSLSHWHFPPEYESRSAELLNIALDQIGMYRSWRPYDPGLLYPTDLRYSAMPPLTKKDIREHFPNILPSYMNVEQGLASGEITLVTTSGTTDDKITNLWNQDWWDASERASWTLNSHMAECATGDHHEAILVNPKNVGIASDDVDLPMEKRRVSRFLYLNEKTDPLAWSTLILNRMIAELDSFQPAVIEANPSMLARLCRYISSTGKKVFQPRAIVFTYEYPTVLHYRQIGDVFNVPMVSSYGTTETGYVFMQCEHGKFHQNTDFCRVDFEPFRPEHGGPLLGRILVTPLGNPWNYMLRFKTGDLARIDESGSCPCGRDSGIILSSIEGRGVNLTLTCEGRLVTLAELDQKMITIAGVDEYKLVQTDSRTFLLHVATRRADRATLSLECVETLKDLYGNEANVTVKFESAIAPEESGKYLVSRALFPIDVELYLEDRKSIGAHFDD